MKILESPTRKQIIEIMKAGAEAVFGVEHEDKDLSEKDIKEMELFYRAIINKSAELLEQK